MEMMKVKDISCGYGFTVFAVNDSKAHLYGTGLNKDGQIGTKFLNICERNIGSIEKNINMHIRKLSALNLNSLFLAYTHDKADKCFDVLIQPVPVKLPTESKALSVSAGRSHTIAITEDGELYSMGNNAYGQCGRNVIEDEDYQRSNIIHNVKIPDLGANKVVDATCGMDHR